jgi:poly(hydroxyalkanoate) depolymerase family esterase
MQGLGETTAMLARLRRSMPGGLAEGAAASNGMIEIASFGENPGGLRMLCYAPPSLPPGAPLVVVLHGCGQDGQGYARDAGWIALADRLGFAVLAPEQPAANNPNRCFNWFEPGDIRRDRGEAASIAAMVAAALAAHGGDPRRVYVTGLSAGGAMSAVMLAAYPDLFAGGAIIAGLPYGVARGVPEALRVMSQGDGRSDSALGALVGRRTDAPLRLSIWHGDADHTVSRANGVNLAAQWTVATGLDAGSARVERLNGRTRSLWRGEAGGSVVELNIVHGLGHGTPVSTREPDSIGRAAPYMLETGISSTMEIARFWALDVGQARSAQVDRGDMAAVGVEVSGVSSPADPDEADAPTRPSGLANQVLDAVSAHVPADVRAVIAKALKAAGLTH